MAYGDFDSARGLARLRAAVLAVLAPGPWRQPVPLGPSVALGPSALGADGLLLSEAATASGPQYDDHDLAASSEESESDQTRLIALVELARSGDKEAFGQLYDHYHGSVYRFLYYRTRSATLAEDLTADTFFRALRSMSGFRWQGKDFGAWLMTIARNLCTDHFKAARTRLEGPTEDMGLHDSPTEGPEDSVIAGLTNEVLLRALKDLPDEQRDCIIMRFLQGLSIAETAAVLGRSDGAIKQLQLRGVRNLAKRLPAGLRAG